MKKIIEKKRVTLTFTKLVLDDGYIFGDAYELLDLLETIGEVDGYFERVTVYNEWGKKLDEMKVLSKNSRGSYSAGVKFEEFYNDVYTIVYGKERNEDMQKGEI